ncbi:MAG: tRNA (adenosine(37)-N6)-dimethylallyltransferase MiaA [Phycisphaerales bacterium JB039]
MPPRFPIIIGPTAGGKSELALAVAAELRARGLGEAELVSADAFQVYRGMDIGTAKPSPAEQAAIRHHLIDIVEPTEPFTVAQWLKLAEAAIERIRSASAFGYPPTPWGAAAPDGRDGPHGAAGPRPPTEWGATQEGATQGVPIVVGGTHLYIKALLEGLFEGPDPDPALRAQLAAMDPAERRAELERVDPAAAGRIHPADDRRTIRALEVYRATGRPITDWQQQWDREATRRTDCVLAILDWPTEPINRRINARVRAMIERGLVEEARGLWESGRLGPQAREAIGYKQLIRHFEGGGPLDEAIEQIKIETRRFAKNQRTWLRRLGRHPGAIRVAPAETELAQIAQTVVIAMI